MPVLPKVRHAHFTKQTREWLCRGCRQGEQCADFWGLLVGEALLSEEAAGAGESAWGNPGFSPPCSGSVCHTRGLSLILSELLLRADPYLRAGSWAGAEPGLPWGSPCVGGILGGPVHLV